MKAGIKSSVVLIMLLVAVICSTAFYAKFRTEAPDTDIDKNAKGLTGIYRVLPKGTRVTFICPDNNATLYGMCRYLLAPRYLSFRDGNKYDTALVITHLTTSEDEQNRIIANRRVLWQNTDSNYHYYLTCTQ